MSLIDSINSNLNEIGKSNSDNKSAMGLGKDDFLRLLIASIKYQDPLSPMDSKKMLTQFTQLTLVEKMIEVSERLEDIKNVLDEIKSIVDNLAPNTVNVNPNNVYNLYERNKNLINGD